MNSIILNIGLSVGTTEPIQQLTITTSLITSLFKGYIIQDLQVSTGEWEGITERTLVIELLTFSDLIKSTTNLINLAGILNQEAIALTFNGEGYLLHKEGITYVLDADKFDSNYFKTIKVC
jgi:hypothetical protein